MDTQECFFGKNLHYFRELDGMTKTQLAKILGVSITEIGQLERNEISKPSFQIVEKIADYFGVNMKDMVRTDMQESGMALNRSVNRLMLAASSVEGAVMLSGLDITLKGFQKALAEAQHYSVQRGAFSN